MDDEKEKTVTVEEKINKIDTPNDEVSSPVEDASAPTDEVTEPTDEVQSRRASHRRAPRRRLGYFRRLALLICTGALIFSGYNLVTGLLEYKKASDYYGDLEQNFVTTPDSGEAMTNTPTPPPIPSGDGELPPPDEPPDDPQPSYVEDYAPDIWPVVDFAGLRDINSDIEAWLIGVGTNINYPVVHSRDNTEYLTTMFDGRASKAGALFIDMRNARGFTDRNTIIYGHNMRNHSMLWTVTQYKSQSFYNNHPTLRLITETGNYEIQLFAGFVADASEAEVWRTRFASDEHYTDWIYSLFERSSFKSYVELGPSDRVLTLSTCTYEFTGARYVVMGKLVPVGEHTSPPRETPDRTPAPPTVAPPYDIVPTPEPPPDAAETPNENTPEPSVISPTVAPPYDVYAAA